MDKAMEGRGLLMSEVVEGEPICVEGRELVPVGRVTTYVRRQAFVGTDRLAGRGEGIVQLRPVAVLERSAAGERHIPIRDRTAQLLGGLLLAAFIMPLLLAVAVRLTRKT